jgi:acyl-coenzyme A thioesterase PaaI-like protein
MPRRVATLDLRIDYLRPATPHRDLFARAETYKLARDIAFLRAYAYQDDLQDLVASAAGTFMFTSAPVKGEPGVPQE